MSTPFVRQRTNCSLLFVCLGLFGFGWENYNTKWRVRQRIVSLFKKLCHLPHQLIKQLIGKADLPGYLEHKKVTLTSTKPAFARIRSVFGQSQVVNSL
jgi:hypothetical protein